MNRPMSFGNVPADMLVGAVEKLLAKMDESDLAVLYARELSAMPRDAYAALIESVFNAFRERLLRRVIAQKPARHSNLRAG